MAQTPGKVAIKVHGRMGECLQVQSLPKNKVPLWTEEENWLTSFKLLAYSFAPAIQ